MLGELEMSKNTFIFLNVRTVKPTHNRTVMTLDQKTTIQNQFVFYWHVSHVLRSMKVELNKKCLCYHGAI